MTLEWPKLRTDDVDMARFDDRNEYISVIVTYCKSKLPGVDRAKLLEGCINSLHQYADQPFEVLVHDDTGIELTSLNVKDRITTLILNMGDNLRQTVAQNRMVKLATSRYIMLIEDDIALTRPCFKDIVNVLKKPYVGFINPQTGAGDRAEYLISDDTKFIIGDFFGGTWLTCFTKDTWRTVGGFPEWSHVSGPVFCLQCFNHGYWRGHLTGDIHIARDVDGEDYDNKWRSGHVFGRQNIPRIFNMDETVITHMNEGRHRMTMDNYNLPRDVPASASNWNYWIERQGRLNQLGHCVTSIDWEEAKKHGQDKWKEQILGDLLQ